MSMHKKPLTPIEEAGLGLHGLPIGKPSQLSDVFRSGLAYGQAAERERTLAEVLAGLRSERDTTQLRAIVASVEALRSNA